jgi:hypothetical protein
LFLRAKREKVRTVIQHRLSWMFTRKQNGGPGPHPRPGPPLKNQEAVVQMNLATQANPNDNRRVWLWAFLAVLALSQLYFVRELLAAFVIFAIGFAVIAFLVVTLYMLQKSCELAVARLAALRHPVITIADVSNLATAGNMAIVTNENQKAA